MKDEPYSEEFAQFWAAYPRRVAKRAAFAAFKSCRNRGATLEDIVRGAEALKAHVDAQLQSLQFTPHPATWLNRDQHEDEYLEIKSPLSPAELGIQRAIEAHNAFIDRKRTEAGPETNTSLPSPDEGLGREAVDSVNDAAAIVTDRSGDVGC